MIYTFRYLATASSDNTVKIWNVDGFTLEKTLEGICLIKFSKGSNLYFTDNSANLMVTKS